VPGGKTIAEQKAPTIALAEMLKEVTKTCPRTGKRPGR